MTSSWAWCRTMLENASMWTYAWTSDVSICIDDSYGYLYALRIFLGFSIPSCVVSLAVGHSCVAVWSVECSLSLSQFFPYLCAVCKRLQSKGGTSIRCSSDQTKQWKSNLTELE
jgi:hypothetical protein